MQIRTDVSIEPQEICQRVSCAACTKVGIEEYPNASSWEDAITGSRLQYAQLAPTGAWVCCRTCLSQLMYQSSTAHGKSILRRYELALRELAEIGDEVRGLLEPWECDSVLEGDFIDQALVALGHGNSRYGRPVPALPEWIENNESPAEVMQAAIRDAVSRLQWRIVATAQSDVSFIHRMLTSTPYCKLDAASGILTGNLAKMCAAAANIAFDLKDATTEAE